MAQGFRIDFDFLEAYEDAVRGGLWGNSVIIIVIHLPLSVLCGLCKGLNLLFVQFKTRFVTGNIHRMVLAY